MEADGTFVISHKPVYLLFCVLVFHCGVHLINLIVINKRDWVKADEDKISML